MRNTRKIDNFLLRDGARELARRLPPGWTLGKPKSAAPPVDATVEVADADRRSVRIAFEVRARLDPKGVAMLTGPADEPLIVLSRYLSPSTRDRLRERGLGYLDLTGNVRIALRRPGLYIETEGAAEDPDRQERPARSLRGVKAGRIVRALIDTKRPLGVRAIAEKTNVNAGYVSRVLSFLESEALITRVGHGRVDKVDWQALLRRWASDVPLEARGQVRTYLEPRGLPALVSNLQKSKERYALTGGLATTWLATAPARVAMVWMEEPAEAAGRLGLRPADAGANVMLLEADDEGPFDGAVERGGAWYAAPSQVAADLLTSPGRGPAEGEALIEWMREHEEAWRG